MSLGDRRRTQEEGEAEEPLQQHHQEQVLRLLREALGPDLAPLREQLLHREVRRSEARRSRRPGRRTACRPADK